MCIALAAVDRIVTEAKLCEDSERAAGIVCLVAQQAFEVRRPRRQSPMDGLGCDIVRQSAPSNAAPPAPMVIRQKDHRACALRALEGLLELPSESRTTLIVLRCLLRLRQTLETVHTPVYAVATP